MPSQDYLSALDLIDQQGGRNIAAMQQGQQMRLSDLQYKQLQDQADREKTLRDILQTAAQGAMTQPQPLPDVMGISSYKPEIANGIWGGRNAINPQEAAQVQAKTQDIQNEWDNRANVQTMTPGGFDMQKFTQNIMNTGNMDAVSKALEMQKALKGENIVVPHDASLVGPGGEVKYQGQSTKETWSEPYNLNGVIVQKSNNGQIRTAVTREPQTHINIPSPPVSVVGPDGKPILVSREESIQNRMTPWTGSNEQLTSKDINSRNIAYPKVTASLKTFEENTDNFIKDLNALKNHPGLDEITGFVAGRIPGLTANGRAAQALYDKIMAKGGFAELQNMRNSSPTGGALGNVSDTEGKQLRASFAAIDRRQDAPDVKNSITEAITNLQSSKSRLRDAYEQTYEYKGNQQQSTQPPMQPPTQPQKPLTNTGLSAAGAAAYDKYRKP